MSPDNSAWWKDYKWLISITIGVIAILLGAYGIFFTGEEADVSIKNELEKITDNNIYFHYELFNHNYFFEKDIISELKIIEYSTNDINNNNYQISLEVKFVSKSNIKEAKCRAFLIDPLGIIRYEYPSGVVNNISSDTGLNNIEKNILFYADIQDEEISKIYGEWHLNIVLLDNNNVIIGEIIAPIDIKLNEQTQISGIQIIIMMIIIVILIIASFVIFKKLYLKTYETKMIELFNQVLEDRGWAHMQIRTIAQELNLPEEKVENILVKSQYFEKQRFGQNELWGIKPR